MRGGVRIHYSCMYMCSLHGVCIRHVAAQIEYVILLRIIGTYLSDVT